MTDLELTALRNKIADAETAFHNLMTGQSVQEYVDINGQRTRFLMISRGDLYGYITALKLQLPADDVGGLAIPRPITFWF